MQWITNHKQHIPLIICAVIVLFLSTYKLTESPPIWMDEGIISQVSRNVAESGKYAIQVEPQHFVSAGFVSTSYTTTLPVALSFKLFGTGLLQARSVMVFFLIGIFLALYYFAVQQFSEKRLVFLTMLLMATFAPLYGDGKNVLGEIPGLLFFILGLIQVHKISIGQKSLQQFILTGLFFGLFIVTKPVFIVACPAFLVMAILLRKQGGWKEWGSSVVAFLLPLIIWIFVQFSGDTVSNILSIYANPHSTDVALSVKENIKRFFTEPQPMYFFVSWVLWFASIIVRRVKKVSVGVVEWGAFTFSFFVTLAYLRTIGYYRYFFPAQLFSLFYLAQSIIILYPKKLPQLGYSLAIFGLIAFQAYQTSFNSWVAIHYSGTQTKALKAMVATLPANYHVYVYQAPETVIFLSNNDYSQYLEVTKTITVGRDTLSEVTEGTAQYVITSTEALEKNEKVFGKYKIKDQAEKYVILTRK